VPFQLSTVSAPLTQCVVARSRFWKTTDICRQMHQKVGTYVILKVWCLLDIISPYATLYMSKLSCIGMGKQIQMTSSKPMTTETWSFSGDTCRLFPSCYCSLVLREMVSGTCISMHSSACCLITWDTVTPATLAGGPFISMRCTNFQRQSNRSLKLAALWSSALHIASIMCLLTMFKSGSMVLARKEEASSESLIVQHMG